MKKLKIGLLVESIRFRYLGLVMASIFKGRKRSQSTNQSTPRIESRTESPIPQPKKRIRSRSSSLSLKVRQEDSKSDEVLNTIKRFKMEIGDQEIKNIRPNKKMCYMDTGTMCSGHCGILVIFMNNKEDVYDWCDTFQIAIIMQYYGIIDKHFISYLDMDTRRLISDCDI
jgi:hypothetical protein